MLGLSAPLSLREEQSNRSVVVIGNAMVGGVVKGVQRDFPLAGAWGCPPVILIPPFLEERGAGGEVNKLWGVI